MCERVRELEANFQLMSEYHRQIFDDQSLQDRLLRAVELHSRRVVTKGFRLLRRAVLTQRRVKAYMRFKELRRTRYLKMLTYLYLKQECAMSKHLRDVQSNRHYQWLAMAFSCLKWNMQAERKVRLKHWHTSRVTAAITLKYLRLNAVRAKQKQIKRINSE